MIDPQAALNALID